MTSSPEDWMMGKAQQPPKTKPEGIRAWYDRTTRRARRIILWSTVVAVALCVFLFFRLSFQASARMQTFNGAFTIPISAAIWIAGFIYIFLVPQREAGFRGQEAFEAMLELVRQAVQEQIAPAAEIWSRIGLRVEQELPRVLEESRQTLEETRAAVKKIEAAVEKNEKFSEEARPVIESLRKIEARVEREFDTGLFEEIRTAADSVRNMSGVPKDPTVPDPNFALSAVRRAKLKSMEGRPQA